MPSLQDDPFELLGVPASFPPNIERVEAAWLTASAKLHPDRAPDPTLAAAELAHINQAKETLCDFERCANALLARMGGPTPEQDKALPDGLLVEMLEARDRLEEARGDDAAMEQVEAWARNERDKHIVAVTELFAIAKEAPTQELLADIRMQLNAWRYIERFLEQAGEQP